MQRQPQRRIASLLVSGLLAFGATAAHAVIPAAERQFLLDLYASTNGPGWTNSTNWNGAVGTECTWTGITCDALETHVTDLDLNSNHLVGTLPANLNALTGLMLFDVRVNQLTGTIPSLTGLTNLWYFSVDFNQLTGTIPSLTGLTNLAGFYVDFNQLTGPIPSLTGLTNLSSVYLHNNQLTGPIPSLAGLTNLSGFLANSNQLTGPIPSLAGLTKLMRFVVHSNQLSGDVPAVPSPTNALTAAQSTLCPNNLNHTPDAAWDAATGGTPWYTNCAPLPPPVLAIANASAAEGNSGQTAFSFTVSLSAAPTVPVSVDWASSAGTATLGSDYTGSSGTLNWAAGDATSRTVTIFVNGDTTAEPDEAFAVTLSNVNAGATIGTGTATGTILNDDSAVVPPSANATPVPTLSEWGLMIMSLLLAAFGMRSGRGASRR